MSDWHADNLKERVAYVRGMAKGMNINMGGKEGRLISSILDVLADVADTMNEVATRQDDLEDYVTCMDEDLAKLEGVENDDDWIEVQDPSEVSLANDDMDDEDEMDEEVVLQVECPYCHDDFPLDPEAFDGHQAIHVTCPNCREVLRVEDEIDAVIEQLDDGIDYDDVDMDAAHPYEEP